MATRTSPRYLLRILEAVSFMFQSLGTLQVTAGGSLTQHVTYTQGVPAAGDAALAAVVLTFFDGSTGTTTVADTTTIGETGNTLRLSDILSVSHDATNDRFTLSVSTSGLVLAADEDVYFELSIEQPDA